MKIFVTGISTNVGKTIASAIITEALEADYWKPIQSGDLHRSDSDNVRDLISNPATVIHPESFRLETPASPHLAAAIDGTLIDITRISEPRTRNSLVIEGAGGVLVPLNDQNTIADLIRSDYRVVVVCSHYLGSINHTLLTIEALRSRQADIAGIIYSGKPNPDSERIIQTMSEVAVLGQIDEEPYFDKNVVLEYAEAFRPTLKKLQ